MRYSLLLPISEEALRTLESHLATRTFILGTTLSLADLTLFGALHQAVVGISGSFLLCRCFSSVPMTSSRASVGLRCSALLCTAPGVRSVMAHGEAFNRQRRADLSCRQIFPQHSLGDSGALCGGLTTCSMWLTRLASSSQLPSRYLSQT